MQSMEVLLEKRRECAESVELPLLVLRPREGEEGPMQKQPYPVAGGQDEATLPQSPMAGLFNQRQALNFFLDSSNDVFAVYGRRRCQPGKSRARKGQEEPQTPPPIEQGQEAYEPYYLYLNTLGLNTLHRTELSSVLSQSNYDLIGEPGLDVDEVVLDTFRQKVSSAVVLLE